MLRSGKWRRAPRIWVTVSLVTALLALGAGRGQADGSNVIEKLQHGPGVTNHPVHVRPSDAVSIPEDWPLDTDGTITCLTCHDGLPALDGASGPQLRDFDETAGDTAQFCRSCHDVGRERSAKGMHWLAVNRAHLPAAGAASQRSSGSLDAESRRCMECHDGVTATEFRNSTPWRRGHGAVGDKRRNHPVGVPYARGSGQRRDTQIRNASLLPKEVRLPDGLVSCVSCHNIYNDDPYRLSVPVAGSQLCFACHQMD